MLDCQISHHYLGLFWMNNFLCNSWLNLHFLYIIVPSIHESLCLFQGISLPVKCACGEEYKVCVDLCVRQTWNKCLKPWRTWKALERIKSGLEYVTFYTGNPTNREEFNSLRLILQHQCDETIRELLKIEFK